jgi:hypothetical protein
MEPLSLCEVAFERQCSRRAGDKRARSRMGGRFQVIVGTEFACKSVWYEDGILSRREGLPPGPWARGSSRGRVAIAGDGDRGRCPGTGVV